MILKLALKNLLLHIRRHLLTSVGLTTGILGIILFGGYVLRMEDYLSTHAIFLKQSGHISLLKKKSIDNYYQNPAQYSISAMEQGHLLKLLNENAKGLDIDKIIPIGMTQAMITDGCKSFPIVIQGILKNDMNWITSHPKVLHDLPELIKMSAGKDFWTDDSLLSSNTSPTLWNYFNKNNFAEVSPMSPFPEGTLLNCNVKEDLDKLHKSPDFQVYSQDFFGGLGIVDTTITGLKYSGFSLADEVFLQMKLEQLQNLVKSDDLYKYAIYLKDQNNLKQTLRKLNSLMNESPYNNFELLPFSNIKISPIYKGSMTFVFIMFLFFIILICGVVILTIVNSIQIAFIERKKDISVYKSIGFRNSVITKIFQYEYLFVSLISSTIAIIWGYLIVSYINSKNFRFQLPGYSSTLQFKLEPTFIYILIVFLAILLVVQLACRWQISRLLKKQSIELMRFDS